MENYCKTAKNHAKTLGFFLLISTLMATGCISNKDFQGYRPKSGLEVAVDPGASKEQVFRKLGSPSATSSFGNETWYYISQDAESIGFFTPKVTSNKIIAIEFEDEKVTKQYNIGNEGYKKLKLAKEVTPSEGNQVGVVQQLLGNLGRFNSDGKGPLNSPTNTTPGSIPGR